MTATSVSLPVSARVLVVTHNLGGGVERYVDDLRALTRGRVELDVLRPLSSGLWSLQLPDSAPRELAATDWVSLVAQLRARSYAWVSFQHVHGHPPEILSLARQLGLPYGVTLHDYLSYCPQYTVMDAHGAYCGEPDAVACATCVRQRPHAWGWDVETWRERVGAWLSGAQRVIAPSTYLANRVGRHFPDVTITVWPHPPRAEWIDVVPTPRKVLLVGRLTRAKGLTTLLACARHARDHGLPLHFCVMGAVEHAWEDASLPIQVRGEYSDAQAWELLLLEHADCVWYPGPYPETWCYTLDLALRSGLPVVAADRGAVAERLRDGGLLVAPDADAATWCAALMRACRQAEPVQVQDDGAACAQRRSYAERWLSMPNVSEPTQSVLALDSPEFADRVPNSRLTDTPSLSFLYDQGVVCGHCEAREALRSRLVEVERDYEVLSSNSTRSGRPWYELLHSAADLASQLRTEAEQLSKLQALHEELGGRYRVLHEEHTTLHNQERATQAQLALQADLLLEQERSLAQRNAQLEQLAAVLDTAQSDLRVAQSHVNRANARIQELERSTSWRVTAPLRWVSASARGTARGLGRALAFARYAADRAPMAWNIWRSEGTYAVWQRVRRKYGLDRTFVSELPTVPPPALPQICELTLATCPADQRPEVSIVIPAYGQDAHTFQCLQSLAQHTDLSRVEVIVVDDASPQPVEQGLSTVRGVRFLRAPSNGGFIASCHLGADAARGEWLLMLNNDVQVCAGWLPALQEVFVNHADAGLAGARLVYPNGRLQEAGGIIWQDGSAWNWGRGENPEHPQFRYLRAVDYCSGACLLMRRSDWDALGGFDRHYAPAYYEDTDLAMRVRHRLGKRVVYQPAAVIIHHEGVSSGTDETQGIKRHQVINRGKFFERWREVLRTHRVNGLLPRLEINRHARGRVLVIEACMITPDQDSGSVRMLAMLELLLELRCAVSFVADNLEHRQPYVDQLQRRGVEVWHHPYVQSVGQLIETHGAEFDTVVVCRHYIAVKYVALLRQHAPQARIIFDTVDLHYLREQRQADLDNSASLHATAAKTREQELGVIRTVDLTWVVSPVEQTLLAQETPGARVEILSNIHTLREASQGFAERDGLIFVGGFRHPPNIDAVQWFVQEVWPLVLREAPAMRLTIVGSNMPATIRDLHIPGVHVVGFVEEIEPLLDAARISIAPLRYGAGVKGKINQAMACGLPVVATTPAVEGMGLQDGDELLVADEPADFARAVLCLHANADLWRRLANAARQNVARNFSRDQAKIAIAKGCGLV